MKIFEILLFFLVLSFGYTGLSLAPWVPTKKQDLERIHKLAWLTAGQKFLEIGCGDAKVCHYIAKNNPLVQVVWIELSPVMYFFARARYVCSPQKNLSIRFWNLYHMDFSDYDVIYAFWLPETISLKLNKKLEKELKKWGKFLSYAFEIKDWKGKITKDKPEWKLALFIHEHT